MWKIAIINFFLVSVYIYSQTQVVCKNNVIIFRPICYSEM